MKLWRDIRYGWIFFWSGLGLFSERLWNAFWPALSVLALFAGLALLNVPGAFGPAGHAVFLLLFVAAIVLAATRLGASFRMPRAPDIRRAIERESGLRHRPLESLLDRPVAGTDPEARQLWQKYQERVARLRDGAKTYVPQPDAARRDPWSLRVAAALILVIGVVAAQGDAFPRLRQALRVDVAHWVKMTPAALDVWITPPDYTRRSPVFLATTQLGAAAGKGAVEVPEGSLLKVRLAGAGAPPRVTYGDAAAPPFTEPAPKSFTMEMPLTKSGLLKVRQGWFSTLGEWPVAVTADAPPDLAFLGAQAGDRATLKIRFRVRDDYGIAALSGTISPTEALRRNFGDRTLDFDIPVPADLSKDEQVHAADLAAHPWAGAEVMLALAAADAAGHRAETAPQKIVLPERAFKNPVAQRIVAERKRLIWYDNILTHRLVINALIDIAARPQNYKDDMVVFLGLDMAAKRLSFDGGPEAVESTVALLWDLAVRVEDGGLSLAARELSEALQKLAEGLRDKDTPKEQLQALMDEVSEKMRDYYKTLLSEMQQRMQAGQRMQMSPEIAEKLMKHIDMQKIMDQMRQLTQGTEREQMEKMAQFLKDSVDRFDPDRFERMQESQRKAMEALEDLQKLIARQQSLLDRTNKLPQGKAPEPRKEPQEDPQQCENPSAGGQCDKPGSGKEPSQAQGPAQGEGEEPGNRGQEAQQQGQSAMAGGASGGAGEQPARNGNGGGSEQKDQFPAVKTPREGAGEQGTIRSQLGDILRKLGGVTDQIPDNFPKADQSMKGSQKALAEEDPRGAAPMQREALDNLQKGQDSLIQQMAKGMEAMMSFGMGSGSGEGGYGMGFDPLGRGTDEGPGGLPDSDVKIPDEKERRRVQQIIEELRARSNDYQRPRIERDYIDRLLEQFD